MAIEITVKDKEVTNLLTRLSRKLGNLKPVLSVIGEIVVESIQRNFEEHRSPTGGRWKELSPAYEKWKTEHKGRNAEDILILHRDLMGSIKPKIYPDKVVVSTGPHIVYAAIHQFGGKTGKGHKTTIPARPYMGVREEDWPAIRSAIKTFLNG